MLSVEEARARVLAPLQPLPAEVVAVADAWGRVLAEPVRARLANPPADVSAMDGYALRAADGALGARLRVVGEAPAGHPFGGSIGPGEAVRLYTGSVIPGGADAVLLQEDATRDGDAALPQRGLLARIQTSKTTSVALNAVLPGHTFTGTSHSTISTFKSRHASSGPTSSPSSPSASSRSSSPS